MADQREIERSIYFEEKSRILKRVIILSISCYLVEALLILSTIYFAGIETVELNSLAEASRMVNAFWGAVLTAIVLIISLTSNTYTPRLSTIFVHQPVTFFGLATILLCNFSFVLGSLLHPGSESFMVRVYLSLGLTFIVIGGIIPYLYYLSQFMRPRFFLPLLEKEILDGLRKLAMVKYNSEDQEDIFENINVLTNIASTAVQRDDRSVIIIVSDMLVGILLEFIHLRGKEKTNWKIQNPVFLSGVSEEARYFLEKNKLWPEYFILSKLLRQTQELDLKQNVLVSHVMEKLLKSMDESLGNGFDDLVEFHIMTFNTILRDSIDQQNLIRFQSICYYYRLGIEILQENKSLMAFASRSFIHYGNMCSRKKAKIWRETILFDLGRIILFLAYLEEKVGMEFYENYVSKAWKRDFQREDGFGRAAWRSLVKTYWEAKAKNFKLLSEKIFKDFITSDATKHLEGINYLLSYSRELHWEINDRLVNFNHLSSPAEKMAVDFKASQEEKVA